MRALRWLGALVVIIALVFSTTGLTSAGSTQHSTPVAHATFSLAAFHIKEAKKKHHRRHHRHVPVHAGYVPGHMASWYNDAGPTASGYHAYYGVANKYLAFGTRVRFKYHGRAVTATVDDRGPYIAGREWDLNQNTAAALGFSGVGAVKYVIR